MNATAWLLIVIVHGQVMATGPYTRDECAAAVEHHERGVCLPRDHALIHMPTRQDDYEGADDVQERLA